MTLTLLERLGLEAVGRLRWRRGGAAIRVGAHERAAV